MILSPPKTFYLGLSSHRNGSYTLPAGVCFLLNSNRKSWYVLAYQMLQELKYIAKHRRFSGHVSTKVRYALEETHFDELLYEQEGELYLCEMGASFLKYFYHIPSWRKLQRSVFK